VPAGRRHRPRRLPVARHGRRRHPRRKDSCIELPETKNGYKDKDGCPDEVPKAVAKFAGVIKGIYFDVNKTTIKPNSRTTLDAAVKVLKDFEDVNVEISGHTDSDGDREHNVELSRGRAESVRSYLVGKGIAESRLVTRGAGPDEPIAPNDTRSKQEQGAEPAHRVQADDVHRFNAP
jgi:outer membrane protein OmpA-like peptidoglycan-associated protein